MTIQVTNYSHIDEAKVITVEGQRYAIAEDEYGYLTILTGVINLVGNTEVFKADGKNEQSYVQIPRHELERVLSEV